MNTAFEDFIKEVTDEGNVLYKEPMSRHTTFQVGGEAECLIDIASEEVLVKLLKYLNIIEIPYFILGNGSNLLVSDKGYDGVILRIGNKMSGIKVEGDRIMAQAGALLSRVAKTAYEHSLTGLEFASGIPGSLGGAIVMNAGAYDGEMSRVVETVKVMNKEGEIMVLDNESMEFSYRNSIIRNRPFIVLEAVLRLQPGEQSEIKNKMDDFAERRREKQPLEYPSAGSTFKRPEGYYAGKLIMDAGLRGYRIGSAQVSEKHCGFIINLGNAEASDIFELIQEIQERVKNQFDVSLERELVILGEF